MKTMYVYILKCSDDTYYTGVTNDLEERLEQHMQGLHPNSYTFSKRPLKIVFYEIFNSPIAAIAFEKKIKRWSKQKKEALIKAHFNLLPELSKKKFIKEL
jgi:putative endonuclease